METPRGPKGPARRGGRVVESTGKANEISNEVRDIGRDEE